MKSKKFINVPPQYLPLEEDALYAKSIAERVTSDSELRTDIRHMFMLSDENEAVKFRLELENKYATPHPKAKAFAVAQKKIHQIMLEEMADLETNLTQLEVDTALITG